MSEDTIEIGEIRFGKLVVPIRQLTGVNRYTGAAIADADLPAALAEKFGRYMTCAACPGHGFAYLHDFTSFMRSNGLEGELTWRNKP